MTKLRSFVGGDVARVGLESASGSRSAWMTPWGDRPTGKEYVVYISQTRRFGQRSRRAAPSPGPSLDPALLFADRLDQATKRRRVDRTGPINDALDGLCGA